MQNYEYVLFLFLHLYFAYVLSEYFPKKNVPIVIINIDTIDIRRSPMNLNGSLSENMTIAEMEPSTIINKNIRNWYIVMLFISISYLNYKILSACDFCQFFHEQPTFILAIASFISNEYYIYWKFQTCCCIQRFAFAIRFSVTD